MMRAEYRHISGAEGIWESLCPAEEVYPLNYHRGLQPCSHFAHSSTNILISYYDVGPELMSLSLRPPGPGELLSFGWHMLHRCTFPSLHLYHYSPEETEHACISLHPL